MSNRTFARMESDCVFRSGSLLRINSIVAWGEEEGGWELGGGGAVNKTKNKFEFSFALS